MPRLAIVANYAFTTWNFRRNLLEALNTLGYELHVISPFDETVPLLEALPGVTCHHLRYMHPRGIAPVRDLLLTIELQRYFKQLQPDLVLLYTIKPNLYGNPAARWAGIPTVSVVTGLGYTFLHSAFLQAIVSKLYRFAFKKTKVAVFHNQEDRDWFAAAGLAPDERCKVIEGSGVNTKHFVKTPLASFQNGAFVFLFAARLVRDKGIMEYIEAAQKVKAQYPNAVCRVIGDWYRINPSVMDKKVFDEAVTNGIIEYDGAVDDVRPYFAAAHAIVLPSYREGLSKTLLEALAMGRPIITSDTPGCRQLVLNQGTGFLAQVKDADSLSEAMLQMLALSEDERDKMAMNGRNLIEKHYADTVILEQYVALVTENCPI